MRKLPPHQRSGHMSGEVKEQHLQLVKNFITNQLCSSKSGKAKILLNINSEFGGSVAGAIGFYDWIRSNKIPLVTKAEGEVASAAVYIFLAGEYRYVAEHCQIFLHRHLWSSGGSSLRLSELKAEAKSMEIQEKNGIKIIQTNTGLSTQQIIRMMNRPTYLSAEQIVKLGFAHEIKKNLQKAVSGEIKIFRSKTG